MTKDDKARGYYRVAMELIDYVWNCADKNLVPLKHDANVFMVRLKATRDGRLG